MTITEVLKNERRRIKELLKDKTCDPKIRVKLEQSIKEIDAILEHLDIHKKKI